MAESDRRASDGASLAGRGRGGEERRGFRAIGIAVSRLAAPVTARRGGGILVRLKTEWAAIVGCDWAATSWPQALGRDGTLRLRVASAAAALELQHRAPLVSERINVFFGRAVVARIALVQGPLPLAPAPAGRMPRPLAAEEAEAIETRVDGVADPELRSALARLGRALAAATPPATVAPRLDTD
jgi:hypothetical protein